MTTAETTHPVVEAGPEQVRGGVLAGRKILIVVENLPVPFDRRVWQEATTLAAAGAVVTVICPRNGAYQTPYEFLDGVHIYRHPMPLEADGAIGYLIEYSAALFWETVLAWRVFFSHGFDTLHGCNPPDLIFLVALQFRLFGVRYIFDHHDINPELYEAKYNKRGFFWRLLSWLEKLSFRAARVVISTNDSYRDIALSRGGKAPEDVFVVRSGPNLKRLRPREPEPALKNGRRFLVGYVGVMGQQEGIDLLLEAARRIVHDLGRTDVQFCLVGGGPSLQALKAMSREMGLADYVTFTGRAPDETLFAVLSTADVCVNPDRVNPMNDLSTMNKILEYMAFGKPIVQFDVKEGRYSAQEASLYARPNDARDLADQLLALLENEDECRRRGELGRRRVTEALSWEHQVPRLIEAYQRCAPGRGLRTA